jgi:hypothetical protein
MCQLHQKSVVRSVSRRRLVYAAALICLAWGTPAHSQAVLKWKFEKGQVTQYRFSHHSVTRVMSRGQEFLQDYLMAVDFTWTALETRPDGGFLLSQSIDRVKVDIKGGATPLEFDSATDLAQGEGANALKELYSKVIKMPCELVLASNGAISDVRVPQSVTEFVRSTPVAAIVDGGSFFSAEGIKNMLAQVIPVLPTGSSAPGASWSTTLEPVRGPILQMKLVHDWSWVEGDHGNALIKSSIKTEVAAARGVQLDVVLDSQEARSQADFDFQSGRLESSKVEQDLAMTFGTAEREVKQRVEIQTGLTHLPDPPAFIEPRD